MEREISAYDLVRPRNWHPGECGGAGAPVQSHARPWRLHGGHHSQGEFQEWGVGCRVRDVGCRVRDGGCGVYDRPGRAHGRHHSQGASHAPTHSLEHLLPCISDAWMQSTHHLRELTYTPPTRARIISTPSTRAPSVTIPTGYIILPTPPTPSVTIRTPYTGRPSIIIVFSRVSDARCKWAHFLEMSLEYGSFDCTPPSSP